MIKYFKVTIAILILLALNGCGFALKSHKALPPQLNHAYLESNTPFATFEVNLKRKLKTFGINLAESPQKSSAIININSNYSYDTNSPTSSSEGRICDLNYTATTSISNIKNEILLNPQTVTITRSINLQPNEVLATTPQITIAKKEMVKQLTIRITNILGSQKAFQALKKHKNEN